MNYNTLLDAAVDLGYELAMAGAETFRVEESISRVLKTYGIESEVFAIPNCLTVSIETPEGKPMTRMRRIGYHGNDLDSVEQYSGLSRAICNRKPAPEEIPTWLDYIRTKKRSYNIWLYLIGSFLGAFGFCMLFGGGILDALCSGICGIAVGLVNWYMDKWKANPFFRTILAAFLMAIIAYGLGAASIVTNPDVVNIGALMILVPGLLFTNAMRDIIYGDTNSGTNRIVQVLLVAAAIGIGTGAAWSLAQMFWGTPVSMSAGSITLLRGILPCFVGCLGFSILFNVHGKGIFLCILGGMGCWAVYTVCVSLGAGDLMGYFWGTVFAAAYAEVMARIRKCPAITYLVIAIFPLIPGAGVYYTTEYAMEGNMEMFASKGMHTAAVAGIMAVAILLVSTAVRMITARKTR